MNTYSLKLLIKLKIGVVIQAENAFIPRTCCDEHAFEDSKTPGLFKIEFQGSKMLCLSFKTQVGSSSDGSLKISFKGVNKSVVLKDNPLEIFNSVLQDKKSSGGVNVGFRMFDGKMSTYTQTRSAFPYLYFKREVLADGVTTKTLDIVKEPKPLSYFCIQEKAEALCCHYISAFEFECFILDNIYQAWVYH